MVGTDINKESIENANLNVQKNNLQHLIQSNYIIIVRKQLRYIKNIFLNF